MYFHSCNNVNKTESNKKHVSHIYGSHIIDTLNKNSGITQTNASFISWTYT